MARRPKRSPLEDMLDVIAMMPWWVGVVLAAISYVVFHQLAAPVEVKGVQAAQVGNLIARSLISNVASVVQYFAPLICLGGAALSFFRGKRRQGLVDDVAQADSANSLEGMSWREFEVLVGEAYRLQGYRVTETGGGGADGGIDLLLTKDSERTLVQCKQWKAFKVGVTVVRELYGVMAAKGVAGGIVVTSGRFTGEAKAFAEGRNIELIDGPRLHAMIQVAKQSIEKSKVDITTEATVGATELVAKMQPCPKCGAEMIKRTAQKGANAGKAFWGCSTYPVCRGTRAID